MRIALSHGPVVACEVVISEVVAGLGHGSVVIDILEEAGIGFMPLELRSAVRAGEMQRRYKERLRAGKPLRVLAQHLLQRSDARRQTEALE